MLLPFGCGHDRSDCCACRGTQHGNDMGVLGAGPDCRLGDAGADRLRDVASAVFRAGERVAAFGLDLDLVMGSSQVHATPSAAPPHPRPGKLPGRARPRSAPYPLQVTTATLRSDKKASQF